MSGLDPFGSANAPRQPALPRFGLKPNCSPVISPRGRRERMGSAAVLVKACSLAIDLPTRLGVRATIAGAAPLRFVVRRFLSLQDVCSVPIAVVVVLLGCSRALEDASLGLVYV